MKKIKKKAFFLSVVVLVLRSVVAQIIHYDTKLSVKVVDVSQEPVERALVRIAFGQDRQLARAIQVEGVSDSNGVFSVQHTSDGHVFWEVQKKGYYPSSGYDYLFSSDLAEFGRWQPWGIIFTAVLQKIICPVPMYVRKVEAEIPRKAEPIGFDLEKGDWVSPYGGGTYGDVIFCLSQKVVDKENYEASLKITFPNKGDGIQETTITSHAGSQLKFPHQAPETGYSNEMILQQGKRNGVFFGQTYSLERGYFMRVRTVLDEDGKVISAKYGKISGSILLSGIAKANVAIKFLYYLNPDGSRNLEYSGVNLFSDDKRPYPP